MSIYSSIYIPRMSIDHNEESIAYYISQFQIGTVSHIDFTPINKQPGFSENVDQVAKSAFIHFSNPRFCFDKLYLCQDGTDLGCSKFWKTIASGEPYKLQVSRNEYWLCLKNKNPIQRTMMNIHQVVENGRYLEELIEEQSKKIQEQAKKIAELEDKFILLENNDDYERKIYGEYVRLEKVSQQMEYEMNEYYEDNDHMREYLKRECININNQKINITKMYEKKNGLPWSYLLNKISKKNV
jgi:hypothetical protein